MDTKEQTVNERLTVLDGWKRKNGLCWYRPDGVTVLGKDIPDYLNDWNALKRLEAKAREKGGYEDSLMGICGIESYGITALHSRKDVHRVIAATPGQTASAILEVLE